MNALRPIARRLLYWRFLLFQRHRHNRLAIEQVAGEPIVVLPGVFNPKLFRSGEILARLLGPENVPQGGAVLDMGTGTGVGAIFAARRARCVVAVDVNPAAVRCARINALLHGCEERVDVREGDLFEPVEGERFDLVLFNPPYYPGAPRDALDRAFHATDVVERFAAGLGAALAPGGRALLVVSTDMDLGHLVKTMRSNGFEERVVYRKAFVNETVIAYAFARRDGR